MKKHEYVGKNREEALELALSELKCEEKDLIINESEQKGGLFKAKKVEIEVGITVFINEIRSHFRLFHTLIFLCLCHKVFQSSLYTL